MAGDSKVVNTLDDPKRWKRHERNAKQQHYKHVLGSRLFRDNYDLIRWGSRSDKG